MPVAIGLGGGTLVWASAMDAAMHNARTANHLIMSYPRYQNTLSRFPLRYALRAELAQSAALPGSGIEICRGDLTARFRLALRKKLTVLLLCSGLAIPGRRARGNRYGPRNVGLGQRQPNGRCHGQCQNRNPFGHVISPISKYLVTIPSTICPQSRVRAKWRIFVFFRRNLGRRDGRTLAPCKD
jgi:hypothetical protein